MNVTGTPVTLVSTFHIDDLFDQSDEAERAEVERLFVERTFRFDELVFEQCSSEAMVWTLVSGSAVYSRYTQDREPSAVRVARAGEVFGLTETLARVPFDATLRTISACVCRKLDHESLVEVIRRRPNIRQRVLLLLAETYRTALAGAANARTV